MTTAGRIKRVFSWLLKGVGAVCILLAVLSTLGSLVALSSRVRYGRGIMFADVEVLAMVAVACAVPGLLTLWAGARLGKS